jgi:hypothetical protein
MDTRTPSGLEEADVHVAVVQSGSTICHVSVAATTELLARHLAEYVRDSARYQLCPGDARRVEALLESGQPHRAVDHYFDVAGHRWGRELLVVRRVALATAG